MNIPNKKYELEKAGKFICPYCHKETNINECYVIDQEEEKLGSRTRGYSKGGRHYIEKINIYKSYNIRYCKDCYKRKIKIRKISAIIFILFIPFLVSLITTRWNYFIPCMFIGAILWFIVAVITKPGRVDVEEAYNLNALHPGPLGI